MEGGLLIVLRVKRITATRDGNPCSSLRSGCPAPGNLSASHAPFGRLGLDFGDYLLAAEKDTHGKAPETALVAFS